MLGALPETFLLVFPGQEVREGVHRLPEAAGGRGQRSGCRHLRHRAGNV